MTMNPPPIVAHPSDVSLRERNQLQGYRSGLLWFYGLSASGKSTLAHAVEKELHQKGVHCTVLDGDNIRTRLNSDLGLSEADRRENIRRVAEVGRILVEAGLLVMAAFITPFRESREQVRRIMDGLPFYECYVKCSVTAAAERDPKGLYRMAMEGKITDLTGVGSPFEEPLAPDLVIDTERLDLPASVQAVLDFLHDQGLVKE
eukprot:TRINITY_DN20962_c0_g2_i1.p6 TRINITY_DN20962_c0_g2~~TRINITY_DN20962_c0_g2_i1.p6  ORF type:complete len:203 (+),score=81.33 TRINITY_DN20962_c0_g2_i1:934-1542(+)